MLGRGGFMIRQPAVAPYGGESQRGRSGMNPKTSELGRPISFGDGTAIWEVRDWNLSIGAVSFRDGDSVPSFSASTSC